MERPNRTRPTNRWTGAAGACFASNLARRRLNEIAPPGQLQRWVQLLESHRVKSIVIERIIDRHVFGMWVCLGSFLVGAVAIPVQQYYRGKVEAYWDISRGIYKGWRCADHFDPTPTQHFDDLMLKYANFQIETTNDCDFKKRG